MTESINTLFSIIVPTYNRVTLLKKAIESILVQSFGDWELIIADDGSTDKTFDYVNGLSDDRIKYVLQKNQGQSVARNEGVRQSSGSHVIFMDDDDYWAQNHLSIFKSAIELSGDNHKIFRTGFTIVKENGERTNSPNYDFESHENPVHFAAYNMCGLYTLCIPREFLVNEHSPVGFPHWQDTHLILRLLAKHPFEQLPCHTYFYVQHKGMGSKASNTIDQVKNRAMVNVEAIEDFFTKHGSLVNEYLPPETLQYLKAEKYIEYANVELVLGRRTHHWQLLKKSLSSKIDLRLIKHYLLFVKYFVLRK